MSVMAASVREMRASYAFIERNFNLSKRYFGWEVVFLVYSVVQALAVLYIGASMGQGYAGAAIKGPALTRTILFLAIGALVWSYLSTVFELISETITWERWEGTIEYTLMAPVSRVTHLLGASVFGNGLGTLWPDLWPLLVIGAASIPLGMAVFLRAERYAKRTGRLKRSG